MWKDLFKGGIIVDKYIKAPLNKDVIKDLQAGDYVYITGTIYTARDAAHKRMYESLQKGEKLPIDVDNQIIYYLGPSPAREGRPIGSAGPTTSSRMDKYTPSLLELGLGGMIGKGKRNQEVIDSIDEFTKGEFVIIVDGAKEDEKTFEMSVNEHIEHFLAQGYTKKEAIKAVAKERGVHKNEIYKYTVMEESE